MSDIIYLVTDHRFDLMIDVVINRLNEIKMWNEDWKSWSIVS